ncbi:hypothetical protein E2C01_004495 [Portunus trituberculatus]|uniref:Uncharacterized protein n=1 Tax=Portunus trituberculatus TaxID=210409 RepID=A0A5B7CQU5_PORTR|nr:hypothetical protein [Portunus trituberculatus]
MVIWVGSDGVVMIYHNYTPPPLCLCYPVKAQNPLFGWFRVGDVDAGWKELAERHTSQGK